MPILWIYDNSGKTALINIERTRDNIAATITDNVVAFFQKRATKKITSIPGVNSPVKFCIY